MLKGISPIIPPDLLKILCEMGHGDFIVLADAHFPSCSLGPQVIRADGNLAGSGILFNRKSPAPDETFVTRKASEAVSRLRLGLQDCFCMGGIDARRPHDVDDSSAGTARRSSDLRLETHRRRRRRISHSHLRSGNPEFHQGTYPLTNVRTPKNEVEK